MAKFVTLRGRRGRDTSFCIDHIQQIVDTGTDGSAQMHMLSFPTPIEVPHTRKDVLAKIQSALTSQTEDA